MESHIFDNRDDVDVANDAIEENLQRILSQRPRFDAVSLFECEECEEVIPMQRRRLGGVKLCIGCQTALEQRNKHFGVER